MIAAQGLRNVGQLIAIARADGDRRLLDVARRVLQVLASRSRRRLPCWSGSCSPIGPFCVGREGFTWSGNE
jgi:hypothetical protein